MICAQYRGRRGLGMLYQGFPAAVQERRVPTLKRTKEILEKLRKEQECCSESDVYYHSTKTGNVSVWFRLKRFLL